MTAAEFLDAPDVAEGAVPTFAHTFATPSDLSNYQRTGSLLTGDNGIGHPDLGGLDTTREDVPMVALPEDVLIKRFGSVAGARGQYVNVTHTGNGQTVRALIGDVGPGQGSVRRGIGLDLNPGAAAALGATGEDPVQYTFAGAATRLGSASAFLDAPDNSQSVAPPSKSLGSAAAFLDEPDATPAPPPPPPAAPATPASNPLAYDPSGFEGVANDARGFAGSLLGFPFRAEGGAASVGASALQAASRNRQQQIDALQAQITRQQGVVADTDAARAHYKELGLPEGGATLDSDPHAELADMQQRLASLQSSPTDTPEDTAATARNLQEAESLRRVTRSDQATEKQIESNVGGAGTIGAALGKVPDYLVPYAGIPIAIGEAHADARQAAETQAQAAGKSPKEVSAAGDAAANRAAALQAPILGAYGINASLAGSLTDAALERFAVENPAARGAIQAATGTAANVGTSTGIRALEQATNPDGPDWSQVAPTLANSTGDLAFGLKHGIDSGLEAGMRNAKMREALLADQPVDFTPDPVQEQAIPGLKPEVVTPPSNEAAKTNIENEQAPPVSEVPPQNVPETPDSTPPVPTPNVVLSYASKNRGDQLVTVDVPKLDAEFAKDPDTYIGPGGAAQNFRPGSYQAAVDHLASGKPYEAAEVFVNDDGSMGFTNGRHRFAALRDAGAQTMRVAMSPEDAENARKAGLLAEPPRTDASTPPDAAAPPVAPDALPVQRPPTRLPPPESSETPIPPTEPTPPGPESQPAPEPGKEPIGTYNASVDAERVKRGLPPIEPVAKQDFGTAWDKSAQILADDPQAGRALVDELNAKPRAVTDEENALLLRRQVDAQTAFDKASDAVNAATPETLDAAKARLDKAVSDLYDVHTAVRAAGAETGRGLNARKMLSTEDYKLSAMLNRKRAANDGKPLTADQTAEVKAAHAKIAELEQKQSAHDQLVQELRDELAAKHPKQQFKQAVRAAKPAKKSLTDFLNDQAEKARERRMERKGHLNSGADPTELLDLAIIGASHIANGVKRFGEWSKAMIKDAGEEIRPRLLHIYSEAKRVHEETLQQLDPARKTPKEIALKRIGTVLQDQVDVISHRIATGEAKPEKGVLQYPENLKKLQQQRDDLNVTLRGLTKRPDLSVEQRVKMATQATERSIKELNRRIGEKDFVPTKRVPVETPELKALRGQRDKLRETFQELKDAAGPPKRTPEEIKLDNLKKSLVSRTAELEERQKNEDFAKRTRKLTQLDEEGTRLKAAHQRAKDAFDMAVERDRLKNRPIAQRAADTFVKAERAIKLTGISTVGKITGATMARVGLTPLEEGIGSITRHLPFVRGVAARAPRYGGGLDLEAERAAAGGTLRGVREIPSILKTGRSDLDTLYGKRSLTPHSPILDAPGALHGAIANPAARGEFARATVQRTKAYRRMGLDVDNPLVKARIATESYQDSQRAVFAQRNFASDGYRNLVRSLENSKVAPNLGFATAKSLDFLFPVVKKPLNILGEGIAGYGTGSITSPVRIIYHALRGGIHNLPPDVADGIMRNLNKGLVGNALLALGYMGYKSIGGQYQQGEKRKPGDVKDGQVRLPDWMGGAVIPKALFESPAFMAMNVGATIHRISEQFDHRTGGLKGIGEASKMSVLGILRDIPFVSTSAVVDKALSPTQSGTAVGRLVESSIVPAAAKNLAEMMDKHYASGDSVKRAPSTIGQSIEMGLPALRQNVPYNTKSKEDREAALEIMTPQEQDAFNDAELERKMRRQQMKDALKNQ